MRPHPRWKSEGDIPSTSGMNELGVDFNSLIDRNRTGRGRLNRTRHPTAPPDVIVEQAQGDVPEALPLRALQRIFPEDDIEYYTCPGLCCICLKLFGIILKNFFCCMKAFEVDVEEEEWEEEEEEEEDEEDIERQMLHMPH